MIRDYTVGDRGLPGHSGHPGDLPISPREGAAALEKFVDDDYCFACGHLNPIGLHVTVRAEMGESEIRWTPAREHQGYSGVLHGGIVSTLLDEAMAYACISLAGPAATAELTVRYRIPVSTTEPVTVLADARRLRGRVLHAEGRLVQQGEVRCTATARFVAGKRSLPSRG